MPRGRSHLAFVSDKEVVRERAQWRHLEVQGNIDTLWGEGRSAPSIFDAGVSAFSPRVAAECNRVVVQELTGVEERVHADLLRMAKEPELDSWRQFEVFSPAPMGAQTEDVVDTRWALSWKEVEGKRAATARLVAEGSQGPDLKGGNVDTAGCVSRRSPRLQPISLGALKKRAIWSLDIKNSYPQADGFDREVCVHAPC